MSYILDALKKAESERKMGGVPDLHDQPVSNLSQREKSAAWNRAVVASAAIVVVAGVIVLTWMKPWQSTAGTSAPPLITAAQPSPTLTPPAEQKAPIAPIASSAPSSNAPVALVAPPSKSSAPAAPLQPAIERQTAPPAAAAMPPVEHKPALKLADQKPARSAASRPESIAPIKQAGAATSAPAADARIPEFGDLPEAVRREIPPFVFGGYLYSSTPADRTVLINNRLLHEGDQIAPGLMLEKMLPKEAVLNYLGYRYRVGY